MDVKPVYRLESVTATFSPDEARQVWIALEQFAANAVLDANSVLGLLHESLASLSEVTQ